MRHPRARLGLEELGSRILPSATPFAPPVTPLVYTASQAPALTGSFHDLDGAVRGTLIPAPGIPDLGPAYAVQGKGKLGGLDEFTVTGFLRGTGFIPTGHASGELTLTNSHGTIRLSLAGPAQPGFARLPGHFHFTVTGGTGAYQGLQDDGEVTLQVQNHGTAFTMVFA
jgi:hypothetical protein